MKQQTMWEQTDKSLCILFCEFVNYYIYTYFKTAVLSVYDRAIFKHDVHAYEFLMIHVKSGIKMTCSCMSLKCQ